MTTTTRTERTELIVNNGPGRWDLMVGLGDGKHVYFALAPLMGPTVKAEVGAEVRIKSLETDIACQLWIVKGLIMRGITPQRDEELTSEFEARYDSRTRKGHFTQIRRFRETLAETDSKVVVKTTGDAPNCRSCGFPTVGNAKAYSCPNCGESSDSE